MSFALKRGGAVNGKYPDEGSVPFLEIRDGKIMSMGNIPIRSLLGDVSFSVYSPSGTPVINNGQTVPITRWDLTRYNTGSFSESLGLFTAPVQGKYSFSLTATVEANTMFPMALFKPSKKFDYEWRGYRGHSFWHRKSNRRR